jgi:hypothetical protein
MSIFLIKPTQLFYNTNTNAIKSQKSKKVEKVKKSII